MPTIRFIRGALFLLAGLLSVALLAPPALANLPIPRGGLDNILLKDRRVIRCKVGEETEGRLAIEMEGHTFQIPRDDVLAIRYYRDFDSTPTNEAEEAKVAKGMVKWEGKWLSEKRATSLREAEEKRLQALLDEDAKHAEWDNRWILETKHFRIEANIPKAKLDLYAEMLEAYYKHLEKQLGIRLKGKWKRFKLPVYFFKHREEYLKRRRDSGQDKGEHALGHFVPVTDKEELVMFDQKGNTKGTLEVMFHEATHFLIYLTDPNLRKPRWMNEACAEYYGGAEFEDGEFSPGQVHDARVLGFIHSSERGKLESLENLIEAGNPGASAGLQSFPPQFYDQSWLIAHYCMNTKKHQRRWKTYLEKILERKVKTEAIEASANKFVPWEEDFALFTNTLKIKDPKDFQKDLLKYARTLPLRQARGYVRRGEMLLFGGDREGARAEWAKAEETAGDDADALFALYRCYSRFAPDKMAQAKQYLRDSVDLDPLDVRKRYEFAQTLTNPDHTLEQLRICYMIEPEDVDVLTDLAVLIYNQKVMSTYKPSSTDESSAIQEAVGFAERAVALAPDHRSRNILAVLRMQQGKFKDAKDLQEKVVQSEPESLGYRDWLAVFAALDGDAALFAKTMRRAELLLHQKNEGDREKTGKFLARILSGVHSAAKAWDRMPQAAEVMKAWFRRPPTTTAAWIRYIRVLEDAGDKAGALEAAKQAVEAFPDSTQLKRKVESLSS